MNQRVAFWGFLALLLAGSVSRLCSQSVTLAWDPNPEPDIAGYIIRYGLTSGEYPLSTNVGKRTTNTVVGLEAGTTYYFVIAAYNTSGLEADRSEELSFTPNPLAAPPRQENHSPALVVVHEESLEGFWKFEEGTGTTTGDSSGKKNQGTLHGNSHWDSGFDHGGALSLDGVQDYVDVPDSDSLEFADRDFTLALWVKTKETAPQALVEKQHVRTKGLFLLALNRAPEMSGGFSILNGAGLWLDSKARHITDGAWHQLVITSDSSGFKFYCDGILDRSFAVRRSYVQTQGPLIFGRFMTGGGIWPFKGALDEIRLYRRALTIEEVNALVPESVRKPSR